MVKQNMMEMKREIDSSTIRVKIFNMPVSVTNKNQ